MRKEWLLIIILLLTVGIFASDLKNNKIALVDMLKDISKSKDKSKQMLFYKRELIKRRKAIGDKLVEIVRTRSGRFREASLRHAAKCLGA